MAGGNTTREEILSLLAHQPRHTLNGMIKITNPATPSTIKRTPDASAELGRLGKLPLELLQFIFSMLDLKTLSHIARTGLRGLAVVESLPDYRDLMRYAPKTMKALGAMWLIKYHSAHALHTALLSTECVSCGEYGPFLFLPTCERICHGCLWTNQSYWVIPIAQARSCFELSADSIKKVPTMRSLPGQYWVSNSVSRKRPTRLVNVKATKELALSEGKSIEGLARALERKKVSLGNFADYYTQKWLQMAPLVAPGPGNGEMRRTTGNIPGDKNCGMAAMHFSSLVAPNRIENGLWCLDCQKADREWSPDKKNEIGAHFSAMRVDSRSGLYNMTKVGWSEAGFFKHLEHCGGAKEMVPDLEKELRQMKES